MAGALVLDDDLASRSALDRALSAEGWPVRSASRSNFGIEVAKRDAPDLVLLDIAPPSYVPEAVAASLRIHFGPKLPIVGTGMAAEQDLLQLIHAFDFLPKPPDIHRVQSLLRRAAALLERNARLRTASEEARLRLRESSRGWLRW